MIRRVGDHEAHSATRAVSPGGRQRKHPASADEHARSVDEESVDTGTCRKRMRGELWSILAVDALAGSNRDRPHGFDS